MFSPVHITADDSNSTILQSITSSVKTESICSIIHFREVRFSFFFFFLKKNLICLFILVIITENIVFQSPSYRYFFNVEGYKHVKQLADEKKKTKLKKPYFWSCLKYTLAIDLMIIIHICCVMQHVNC